MRKFVSHGEIDNDKILFFYDVSGCSLNSIQQKMIILLEHPLGITRVQYFPSFIGGFLL